MAISKIRECFNKASQDEDVRCVIFEAKGTSFSIGLDLAEINTLGGDSNFAGAQRVSDNTSTIGSNIHLNDPARRAARISYNLGQLQKCVSSIAECAKPVICVMHGHVIGGAIDLASAADMRLCSEDAKFAIKEVDIGLAADLGTLQRLPLITRSGSWARWAIFSGSQWNSKVAKEQGFVHDTFVTKEETLRAAINMAQIIVRKSPVAVAGSKMLLNYSMGRTVNDGLQRTLLWNAIALQTSDIPESVLAFYEKRAPIYSKL